WPEVTRILPNIGALGRCHGWMILGDLLSGEGLVLREKRKLSEKSWSLLARFRPERNRGIFFRSPRTGLRIHSEAPLEPPKGSSRADQEVAKRWAAKADTASLAPALERRLLMAEGR